MVTEQEVIDKLKTVTDPHVGVDVYTMGLIKDIVVEGDEVSLTFVPSSPFCPMGIQLAKMIKDAVADMDGVTAVVTIRGHIQEKEINKALNEC